MEKTLAISLLLAFTLLSINCVKAIDETVDDTNPIENTTDAPSLTVKFTTKTSNGVYGPRHTKAVWIEDETGNVVKTLGRWGDKYVWTLAWNSLTDVDSDTKTGASETSHGDETIENWGLNDKNGNKIAHGTYALHIEFNENNNVASHELSVSTFSVSDDQIIFTEKNETETIFNIELNYKK